MIRYGEIEDLDGVIDFERSYMKTFEQDSLEKWEKSIDKTRGFLEKHLNQMAVIEDEEGLAGFAYWSIHESLPCVFSIYVHENRRKKGYGAQLLTRLEEQIKREYDMVTLSTRVNNPAQHLFDKMKYERIDVKDGWIYYEKKLR